MAYFIQEEILVQKNKKIYPLLRQPFLLQSNTILQIKRVNLFTMDSVRYSLEQLSTLYKPKG